MYEGERIKIVAVNPIKEKYEASIPQCCSYRTPGEHEDMGLCWGLLKRIEENIAIEGLCDECDLNVRSPFFQHNNEDNI